MTATAALRIVRDDVVERIFLETAKMQSTAREADYENAAKAEIRLEILNLILAGIGDRIREISALGAGVQGRNRVNHEIPAPPRRRTSRRAADGKPAPGGQPGSEPSQEAGQTLHPRAQRKHPQAA